MLKNFKPRLYQQTIFSTAVNHNTLVVLPTGMGKTSIAILLAIQRLKQYPSSKILIIAPTKPLVQQHYTTFQQYLDIDRNKIAFFTGTIKPEIRHEQWKTKQIIFSTPQGLENDLLASKIDLTDVSLLVIDEAHRAVKEYSYVWLAQQYNKLARHPKILGLTASPGSDEETITEVCNNLFIEEIEIRTDKDPDVKPYIQNVDVQYRTVQLPEEFKIVRTFLTDCLKTKLREISSFGYLRKDQIQNPSRREMLSLQAQLRGDLSRGDRSMELLRSLSLAAEAMKVQHALELIESQGIQALHEYVQNIQQQATKTKVKATQNLARDIHFRSAAVKTKELFDQKKEHPKIAAVKEIVLDTISKKGEAKIIIFCQYRDTVVKVTDELQDLNIQAKSFVGQAKKKTTGMSQKQQIELLNEFRDGLFNVLIASSVGEEGLDIPSVDKVIFYEPVPSSIRTIQRRGRTGRLEDGSVIVMVAKGTRDEAYRWSSHHKENRMYRTLKDLKQSFKMNTKSIQVKSPTQKHIKIFADHREKGSGVLKELVNQVNLDLQQLPVGDFILSSRCAVEYKNQEDFIQSIIDGRLLQQLKEICKYPKPILLIEGDKDIYALRNIHRNSIQGMLATIAATYNIPILYTKDSKETAQMLIAMAKREQEQSGKDFSPHTDKPTNSITDQQEYVISSLPGVGGGLAKDLLKHFKTVKNIINASEDELKNIEKIGDLKATKIRNTVLTEYK